MEDIVVPLCGNAGRETQSSPDTNNLAVIRTVFIRSAAKVSQSSAFQIAVERAVRDFLAEPSVANYLESRTIDLPGFMVPVAKFIKDDFEKRVIENAELDGHRNVSNKAVVDHNTLAEDKFLS